MKKGILSFVSTGVILGITSVLLTPGLNAEAQENVGKTPSSTASAQTLTKEQMKQFQSNLASFDLTKKETQEKVITLGNGEKAVIGIEPIASETNGTMERSTFQNVKVTNGKFHAYWKSGVLNLSFYFDINNLRITRAYDASYSSIGVVVKSANLKLDSSKQATYYIEMGTPIWDFGGASGWLRAKISGDRVYFSIA